MEKDLEHTSHYQPTYKKVFKGDEVDLKMLTKVLYLSRRKILVLVLVFCALGLTFAFLAKVEYKASCKLLPESQDSGLDLGGFGGLAGLAGLDVSGFNTDNVLTPELYPELAKSTPFLLDLLLSSVYFEKSDTIMTSFYFLDEVDRPSIGGLVAEYTIGLPYKVKELIRGSDKLPYHHGEMRRFSQHDWELIEDFAEKLAIEIDDKTGIITVSVEMSDPVAAAEIAKLLVERLTESVINYRIEKASQNLDFINEQFQESRQEYLGKQDQVAGFADNNSNIRTSRFQSEYERLQNERDIAFEVYKGLASQLEQAKIKVKEETPVFTILEPVRIPEEKSKPRRGLVLLSFFGLGLIVSTVAVLLGNESGMLEEKES